MHKGLSILLKLHVWYNTLILLLILTAINEIIYRKVYMVDEIIEEVESYWIAVVKLSYYFNDIKVACAPQIRIHSAAHTGVFSNGLFVNRYLCTYLFTAHIITPSQVLLFCAYSLGLFLLLNFAALFSTFLIQYVVNGKIKPNWTKARDMRFHWLRDR